MHLLAIATAGATFVLLLIGGLVHGTASGMACPESSLIPLPMCSGELFPELTRGILFEHYAHRFFATVVGIMTVALAVLMWRGRRRDAALRPLGVVAVALVVFQGLLGRLTVLYNLPPPVSIAHLGTSMVFFSLVIYVAFRTRVRRNAVPQPGLDPGVRRWIVVGVGAVYAQIVLGAAVRHLQAGMACLDLPFCFGEVWPSAAPYTAKVHMAHRMFAVVVTLLVLGISWRVFRATRQRGLRLLAAVAPVLVLAQVGLGVLSVLSLLGLVEITAHLGMGALLLACLLSMYLAARPRAASTLPASASQATLPLVPGEAHS